MQKTKKTKQKTDNESQMISIYEKTTRNKNKRKKNVLQRFFGEETRKFEYILYEL